MRLLILTLFSIFSFNNIVSQENFDFKTNGLKKGVVTTSSGLQYKHQVLGTGTSPNESSTVTVHYKGYLTNGTVFDNSYARNQPARFPLNGVIKGWQEGLQHMKAGGKTTFYIPHNLAYGAREAGPIPPYATLIFEVELLDVDHTGEKLIRNETKNSTENNIRIRIGKSSDAISNVAVIGKKSTLCDGSVDDGQNIAELAEGELLGIYGVVERNHLEEILNEQRLAMSGLLLDDNDYAQAGCLAGAQGTVLVSYGCIQGQTKLQIKLVDCSTSDMYWSAIGLDVSAFDLMDALRVELGK